jgi:hypothetical protein
MTPLLPLATHHPTDLLQRLTSVMGMSGCSELPATESPSVGAAAAPTVSSGVSPN